MVLGGGIKGHTRPAQKEPTDIKASKITRKRAVSTYLVSAVIC